MENRNRRELDERIQRHFDVFKQAIVLLGARQVGKTTLLRRIFPDALYLLIDEEKTRAALEAFDSVTYRSLIGEAQMIILDEIHLLSNPGRAVKIIYDQFPGLKIAVTGSSSLHIKNRTSESMAGRSITYELYPLTFAEYIFQLGAVNDLKPTIFDKILRADASESFGLFDKQQMLENILLYGQYPEVINTPEDRVYLANLADSAIFKDIIELDLIDNRAKAKDLLRALAYQIGNLVNYAELARKIGLSQNTVKRYIEIFEQSFILYRVYPFSRNKRNEIGRMPKIYFWDLGLRNALIDNFQQLKTRDDSGAMFENFIISEVKKSITYMRSDYKVNYWRTKNGSEVDLILSNHSDLLAVEIKTRKGEVSKAFLNRYPEARTHVVTTENFF